MNATLDQALAKAMQLRGASCLFVARVPIRYQKGCGVGRPQFGERVLLVHPKDSDHVRTWQLPDPDVAPKECLDSAVPFGDVLLSRCGAEFEPSIDKEKYDVTWVPAEFAVTCANDPKAMAAIEQFLAEGGDNKVTGELVMDSAKDFIDAQSAAEPTYRAFNDSAPARMQGEPLADYEGRLVRPFQAYCKRFEGADLAKIGCPITRRALAGEIYKDALQEAVHPTALSLRPGELRAVIQNDGSGRPFTRYIASDDGACWDRISPPRRFVTRPKWLGMSPGRVA